MDLEQRVETLERRHDDHARDDHDRFAAVTEAIEKMNARLMDLWTARVEQVGAAKAIAELAEKRASRNTRIVALLTAAGTVLTLCIQKHWLGL